jgi:hypothetical protein
MASVTGFRVAGALVAAVLAVAPLLPAQHVHEAEEHGHLHRTVHQHLSPHALLPEAGFRRHVEDDDEPILTLSAVFTIPASVHAVSAPPVDAIALVDAPPVSSFHRHVPYVEPLIHGPPRAPAPLRGPPFLPAV